MRLPPRRIATSALCATLVFAVTGPTAIAADGDSARERTHAASKMPVPGANALLAQVDVLDNLEGVLEQTTDLLSAVLKADNGQLDPTQAAQLADAVNQAITEAALAGPVTPATPPANAAANMPGTTPPGTTLPAPATTPPNATLPAPSTNLPGTTVPKPATNLPGTTVPAPAGTQPFTLLTLFSDGDDGKARKARARIADLRGEALASLQRQVDTLVKATTSGEARQVAPAVNGVVTGLVNVTAATLTNGGLPAPNLPGLPPSAATPPAASSLPPVGLPPSP